ncbi:kama family protein [Dothidotthia symphoricarpi CBS 119687]|uniref:Kama family protein n=1 Tax=Dothidotthia symphoricarpi CBS 119687 TaxID=1392245 RepID=A0A6A6AIK6_9PLEO|nr:kama family protein [Dothidotthia symphoricarpi CBS 119687]KAF2130918.1 kama family protein [Dothidotthia symphoricarpi CBS 119687]
MFSTGMKARNLTLRSRPFWAARLLQQNRAQSTLRDRSRERYWDHIEPWKDVSSEEFISYRWQLRNTIPEGKKLQRFLHEALPDNLGPSTNPLLQNLKTRDDFIADAVAALKLAPMAIRLTPQVLSRIDWENPLDDPIRKQFLPLASGIIGDHKKLTLDSLHEEADSPVPGLVHRYPGRALFLATSICPVYCRFCTRSYAVGANTDTVSKSPQKPSRKRWELIFQHIETHSDLQDIVVSGGDAYYLQPEDLKLIGERLLSIPHIRRVRFASKGLAVAPGRILDRSDPWADTLIDLSNQGRKMAKQVCLHTHFNHANEITWITRKAAHRLYEHGVIVRNQSVLLNGVNNNFDALSELITQLADMNIQPYYVYQCDMVRGIEDLRTPLSEIIKLDKQCRGTLSGFMMPSFVVDLPGGGGKRLVSTYETYDEKTGEATYTAPGLPGLKGEMTYTYWDPVPVTESAMMEHRLQQEQALLDGKTLEQQSSSTIPLPQEQIREKVNQEPEPAGRLPVQELLLAPKGPHLQQDHRLHNLTNSLNNRNAMDVYQHTSAHIHPGSVSRIRNTQPSAHAVASEVLHISDAQHVASARSSSL